MLKEDQIANTHFLNTKHLKKKKNACHVDPMTNLFKEIQIMVLRKKSGTSIERNFYWMSKSSSILKFHYFLKVIN